MEEKIVIFGATNSGVEVFKLIQDLYLKNQLFFCDNNKKNESLLGIKVLDFDELVCLNKSAEVKVIIASSHFESILKQCIKNNIKVDGIYHHEIKTILKYESLFEKKVFSQDGEDILLKEFFYQDIKNGYKGTYVDVGAHHPYRFSNTYWAYEIGWQGINIEPNPDAMELFYLFRKRDINLNVGIGDLEGELPYYRYHESAINAFHKDLRAEDIKVKDILIVPVRRLENVLHEYNVEKIDFMSIDVEGYEMEVLQSNDWKRFRPKYILLEQLNFDIDMILDDELYQFMKRKGYKFHSKYNRTIFYIDVLKSTSQ